jgi:hypothetical protein
MKYCKPVNLKKPKHRLNIAIPEEKWAKFELVLQKEWGDSFTSWVEFAMECYSRSTCEGCPYDRDDALKSKGIGKRDFRKK